MLRLFTGIEIASPVRERIENVLRRLRPAAPLQWARDENLHITTTFIGFWPEERVGELTEALGGVPLAEPFEIAVADVGFFPNAQTPRVLMIPVKPSPPLAELATLTAQAMEALGIAREERPYTPHITLARIRRGTRLQNLRDAIVRQNMNFGTFQTREFHLYRSVNGVYTKLTTFPVH